MEEEYKFGYWSAKINIISITGLDIDFMSLMRQQGWTNKQTS